MAKKTRLDRTTNWAILILAGLLTWAFSNPTRLHFVLLIGLFAITFLAMVETRRYRTFEALNSRVRILEENFFAKILSPKMGVKDTNWRKVLAKDLKTPVQKVSMLEAFGRRLRRIYLWLFLILIISWFAKLTIHPTPTISLLVVVERARIAYVSGYVTLSFVIGFYSLSFPYHFTDVKRAMA